MTHRAALAVAVGVVMCAAPVAAQRTGKSLAELAADVARGSRQYRAVLERSVPIHETQVQEAAEVLRERRQFHRLWLLAATDVEQAERARAAAQRDLDEALAAIAEADRVIFEASIQERLARPAPLPRGGGVDTGGGAP